MENVRGEATNANVPGTGEKGMECGAAEGLPCWRRFWLVVAGIWLDVIVLIFVVMQVSRLKTPVVDWVDKSIDLFIR
jgi:hypothetical protein